MNIGQIAAAATVFRRRLEEVKARIAPADFTWYAYDSLATVQHLNELLHDANRGLLELAGGRPVLDAGCGDGAMSFFFESLGCRVTALDHPSTNWNEMRGVRALASELGSAVEIRTVDLDSQFALRESYGLALLFGVLYHLRNPFYALSTLAKHARYCLLSTRIARFTPDRKIRFRHEPMAYLVDEDETNSDSTNFWVFSEAGLKRLFKRTRWELCEFMTTGNVIDSDPVREDRDERAFALLRSTIVQPEIELLGGFHELECETWRWTERRFSVEFRRAPGVTSAALRLAFTVPEFVIARFGRMKLTANANGIDLPSCEWTAPGERVYTAALPASLRACERLRVDFELDHALPPDAADARERGVIVLSAALE